MKYDLEIDMSIDNSITLILRHITPGSCVLEFGPAKGYMTRYLKEELGCTVFCIEIDQEAAEEAKNYSQKMIIADIDSMGWVEDLSGNSFDYIIFADVLEHLKNPWKVLEHAVAFLKNDGTVITSIPNIGHSSIIMELLQGKFEYRPLGLLDDTHIRFFTRKSVLDLLEKAGLCPVEWLVTTIVPENTEFQQKYASFSEPLQEILRSKQDAHIYQFVTVSKRKEDITPEEGCLEFAVSDNFLGNSFLQVFWEKNGDLDQESSAKVPLEFGNGVATYDIILPTKTSGRLWLHIGNQPSFAEINSIMLYGVGPDKSEIVNLLANWSAVSGFKGLLPGSGVIRLGCGGCYKFVCTDDNPQLSLENVLVSENVNSLLLRIVMRVEKHISQSLTKALEAMIVSQEQQLSHQASKLAELQIELAGKLVKLKTVEETLSSLEIRINEILSSKSWKFTKPFRQLKHLILGEKDM